MLSILDRVHEEGHHQELQSFRDACGRAACHIYMLSFAQAQDTGASASQAVAQLQEAQQRLAELEEASEADRDQAGSLQSQLDSFR